MSRPTFYKYLHRFRHYGAWGLVDWMQPGRGRGKISDELELRIIEEKVEHPRFSLDELMARMDLRCSRSALYEVLRYWELLEKERRPVRLRGLWGSGGRSVSGFEKVERAFCIFPGAYEETGIRGLRSWSDCACAVY